MKIVFKVLKVLFEIFRKFPERSPDVFVEFSVEFAKSGLKCTQDNVQKVFGDIMS